MGSEIGDGDKAPGIDLPTDGGGRFRLADHKGKPVGERPTGSGTEPDHAALLTTRVPISLARARIARLLRVRSAALK